MPVVQKREEGATSRLWIGKFVRLLRACSRSCPGVGTLNAPLSPSEGPLQTSQSIHHVIDIAIFPLLLVRRMQIKNGTQFQPTMLGTNVIFQHEGRGMITDETETEIYIEAAFFTGWMSKSDYWEMLGVED